MSGDEAIISAAIDWHIAQADMAPARWEAFVAWLEADAAHARVYDRVAMDDRIVGDARFPLAAANDDAPVVARRRWRWTTGGAVAVAMLAAVLAPFAVPKGSSAARDIVTRPGERRTLDLADGTRIELSGATRVRIDGARPRRLDVAEGEATLHVRHDAADPFTIVSHGVTVQDVGTVFDVVRDGDRLSVAVADGAVVVDPRGAAVRLRRGDALTIRGDARSATRSTVDPASVGGWRGGMVSFAGAPLSDVAAAVRRSDGATVTLDAVLSQQSFTGIVKLTGAADRDVPHLATLIGATWRRDGERWILASGSTPS